MKRLFENGLIAGVGMVLPENLFKVFAAAKDFEQALRRAGRWPVSFSCLADWWPCHRAVWFAAGRGSAESRTRQGCRVRGAVQGVGRDKASINKP
ncbi:hypothetical protein ACFSQE_16645 [Vogesella fluminis]|uniref:hypothetical protein n=1 Tax=Vogesella fluminis TaxID=1069161 RepID=UPI0036390382